MFGQNVVYPLPPFPNGEDGDFRVKMPRMERCISSPRTVGELPAEILENVLSLLPLPDLLLNASLTCKRWNSIICSENFMPSKKRYWKIVANNAFKKEILDSYVAKEVVNSPNSVLKFAKLVENFQPNVSSYAGTNKALRMCRLFGVACSILEQKLGNDSSELNTWSLIFLLVALSSTVRDCCEVVRQITLPYVSKDRLPFVSSAKGLDFLYYIATYLKELEHPCSFSPGIHYRLYYALSQSERGGQSPNEYSFTQEQMRILNHDLAPRALVKVLAFAGTGKTSTLVEYARRRPGMRFLFACFNKSVQIHADAVFPSNVVCRTFHSLAYGAVGYRFKNKLSLFGDVNEYSVSEALGRAVHPVHKKRLVNTLNQYLSSDDNDIKPEHVPSDVRLAEPNEWRRYVDDANLLWSKMTDRCNVKVKIGHDGYLKLWQLAKSCITGYDCLLVDEAQDITPAIASIILTQSTPKIMVGDPHQQIYAFRGATNILSGVAATRIFYLTQSFRFGPEIAYVASCLLAELKGVRDRLIVGTLADSGVCGDQIGQVVVIGRLNYSLFKEAVYFCKANASVPIGFVGGIESYGMSRILSIYKLMINAPRECRRIKLIRLSGDLIKTFGNLVAYAENAPDLGLQGKIKIVQTFGSNVPDYVKLLRDRAKPPDEAEVLFSTVHKAKGLEFSTVRLLDDFLCSTHFHSSAQHPIPLGHLPEDEFNLLYVAATRAKQRLLMSPTLFSVMRSTGEKFVVPGMKFEKEVADLACPFCRISLALSREQRRLSAISLRQKHIVLANGHVALAGGFVHCSDCRNRRAPYLTEL
ncbi:F-box DNA helicase 1-like [Oscarella lobularis]|uniref:F-box DNA helicase 1-like n=1 Tax=Oscarella lobularis TaxID=121494 RepID=UPI003313C7D9